MKIISIIFFALLTQSIASQEYNFEDSGFYGFVGIDLGYATASEDTIDTRSGLHAGVKGLFSYYRPTHIFDLGLGWFYNEIDNSDVTTRTRSLFVEASTRYRLNKKWSIGPIATAALANDNSFAVETRKDSSEFFIGARVDYEPQVFRRNKVRLNTAIQRDLTVSDRSVTLFTVGLQFGFPFKDKNIREEVKVKVIEKIKYVKRDLPTIKKISNTELQATFGSGTGLNFNTNSDKANRKMLNYLQRLSYFLKKYNREWKTIVIAGHTDDVGALKHNVDLSKRRANRVRSIFLKNGIKANRIKAYGYGPKRPLVKKKTKLARARNRRVEIYFKGVKNVDSFQKGLKFVE